MPNTHRDRILRGSVLVLFLMLGAFATIVLGGTTFYVTQSLYALARESDAVRAFYLAQSGVQAAIYDFRGDSLWSSNLPAGTALGTDNRYYVGQHCDLITNDARTTALSNSNTQTNSHLNKRNNSTAVTLTQMAVTWLPAGAGDRLTIINVGGGANEFSGSVTSGTQINMTDFTFAAANTADVGLAVRFNVNMSTKTVWCTYFYGDGSSRGVVQVWPQNTRDFSITSTGRVTRGTQTIQRTVRVVYDWSAGTNPYWAITDLEERSTHVV